MVKLLLNEVGNALFSYNMCEDKIKAKSVIKDLLLSNGLYKIQERRNVLRK